MDPNKSITIRKEIGMENTATTDQMGRSKRKENITMEIAMESTVVIKMMGNWKKKESMIMET